MIMIEEDMKQSVRNYYIHNNYEVYPEVRLFSRNIDLIAKKKSKIVSIELKVRNWKKGIQQSYLNLRVANYSYLALPDPIWNRINRRIYVDAFTHGIGLLSVDGTVRQIMRPERSNKIQPLLRLKFLKQLTNTGEHIDV